MTKQFVETLLTKNKSLDSNKTKQLSITNEELYLIYNEMSIPLCHCGNNKKFINFKKGYSVTCGSKSCKYNFPGRSEKIHSKRDKEKVKAKTKNTWENKTQEDIDIIVTKIKNTKKINHNDENYTNTPKMLLTKQINGSLPNSLDIISKSKATKLERYNDEKYVNPKKCLATKMLKYGRYNDKTVKNYKDLNPEFINENFIKMEILDKQKFKLYYDCSNTFMYKYLRENNIQYKKKISEGQNDLFNLVPNSIMNDRQFIKPLEIDILNNDLKIGIEYHGMFWHSYGFNDIINPNKHKEKADLVESKGYQLFQVFEDEWVYKREIWESMFKSKLNNTERIPARKCIVKELSSSEANKFIDNNHIQGKINSSIRLGLIYKDELVACMTFGKSRLSKQYQYELYRYCNKLNITVIGGFSKLLKYFENKYKPKSLVSYANRRWSTGNVYKTNGFTFSHSSKPNHFYIDKEHNIYSRIQFQKHKLKDKLKNFNPDNSGIQNMLDNGYRIIYDAGNLVYYKKY